MPSVTKIDCPICCSKNLTTVYEDNPSKIVACNQCGLIFFNPQPTVSYLKDYYSSYDGYLPNIEENFKSFKKDSSTWKASAEFILSKISQYVTNQNHAKILDIGCAYGFFLHFAKTTGYDTYGLELSTETSKYAKDLGLEIQCSSLESANYENNFFDVITMNNVLEHTLNPIEDLSIVHKLLKEDGVVYIAVPNFGSTVSQTDKFHWKMKAWPNHLFYFTEQTLSKILKQCSFEVLERFTHAGESDLNDDIRIIKESLFLTEPTEIDNVIKLLWKFMKGQELVIIARKSSN
jgi:2-polyprenyl-3-methyl-5-hydroxy-6-metoxy-1,4-benzoquinol methylase